MSEVKQLGGSMFGYKKSDVNVYIEKIMWEFGEKLKEKDNQIAALKEQLKESKTSLDEYMAASEQLSDDRKKVTEILLRAQEKAESMIDEARAGVVEEKKEIQKCIETEKERLVDIRSEIKKLKDEVVSALRKYDDQLAVFTEEGKNSAVR